MKLSSTILRDISRFSKEVLHVAIKSAMGALDVLQCSKPVCS